MAKTVSYLHSLGMGFGLYGDRGTLDCARHPGAEGHEKADGTFMGEHKRARAALSFGTAICCPYRSGMLSEKDAKLAQKLGQLQPSIAVFPRMHGPTCIFWANLTHFSLKGCSI
jgi:hypothetical protein